jgi:ribosomal silencing factor RsfS
MLKFKDYLKYKKTDLTLKSEISFADAFVISTARAYRPVGAATSTARNRVKPAASSAQYPNLPDELL